MPETISVDPEALRADVRRSTAMWHCTPRGSSTSTRAGRWPRCSATRPRSSMLAPGSGRRVLRRWGNPFSVRPGNPASAWSTSGRWRVRLLRRRPGRRRRRPGDRGRHDTGDARQVPRHGRDAGAHQRRVPRGAAGAGPVEDGWADVVISNGVINLCADKATVFAEAYRVLRRVGRCSSPTSPTASRSPKPRCARSTCGPAASPEACPSTTGAPRSRPPGSPM